METKLAKEQIIEVGLQTKTIANSMGFSLINQLQNIQKEVRSLMGKKKKKKGDEKLKNLRQQASGQQL